MHRTSTTGTPWEATNEAAARPAGLDTPTARGTGAASATAEPALRLFGWLERAWALRAEDRTLEDPRGHWHRIDGQEDYR